MRVLHVVGEMNRAGTETWLMHVLRNIDRSKIQMDFLVHTDAACDYDDEIRSLGGRIFNFPHSKNPIRYGYLLWIFLTTGSSYNVIHSHVHHFSGFVMLVARLANVKVRITHSHSDSKKINKKSNFLRRGYVWLMEKFISHYSTRGLATSEIAAPSLFGDRWRDDKRWQVLYCGIDFSSFSAPIEKSKVRSDLKIPQDRFVLGHVGRFSPVKNHRFLLEMFQELKQLRQDVHLLMVGTGSELGNIRAAVVELGLQHYVTFTGSRDDVPKLMRSAMDIFVFPSLHEGLGLVVVEAQAASLRCIVSEAITEEVAINGVTRLSLALGPTAWAEVVNSESSLVDSAVAANVNALSKKFSIQESIAGLSRIYESDDARN